MNKTHLDTLSGMHTEIRIFPHKVTEFEVTITIHK